MTLKESFPEVAAPPAVDPITEVLQRARDVLADPRQWAQGVGRKDVVIEGQPKHAYCLTGALSYASGCDWDDNHFTPVPAWVEMYSEALTRVQRALDDPEVVLWNDALYRRHSDVLALLDKAINDRP